MKITTDMFDNRKIKHLRRLPDGNNIVLIWVMLLTMAGRCNAGGMIFLTENIPYSPKMLADELDFEENTVTLALNALERFNMIATDGDIFSIAGWEEYQNVEGLDKIREQNRLRKQQQRERQRLMSRDSHATVTQGHATEEDKEEETDKKEENNIMGVPAEQPVKKRSKAFVPPTVDDVREYCSERGNNVNPEVFVDFYESKGWLIGKSKMKDWKAAVRTWERSEGRKGVKNHDGGNRGTAEGSIAGGVGTWL